jgi:hypothetical protein
MRLPAFPVMKRYPVMALCVPGFFDRYKTQPLQIAERLGFIEFVERPKRCDLLALD